MTTGRINQVASFDGADAHGTSEQRELRRRTDARQAIVLDERLNAFDLSGLGHCAPHVLNLPHPKAQRANLRPRAVRANDSPKALPMDEGRRFQVRPAAQEGCWAKLFTRFANDNSFPFGTQHRKPDYGHG